MDTRLEIEGLLELGTDAVAKVNGGTGFTCGNLRRPAGGSLLARFAAKVNPTPPRPLQPGVFDPSPIQR